MNRWPQQIVSLERSTAALDRGVKRICVTAPTGCGKTRMMIDMIEEAASRRWPVALYTNRKLLAKQTKDVLEGHGIQVGMRASGYERALLKDVQICMTQTELSQVIKGERRELHAARLVLVDELHNQTGESMQELLRRHCEAGAQVVGYTATPLDIDDFAAEELIVACTTSEGRECGALVPATTYGPDEPDLRHVKNYKVGDDLTQKDNTKAIMRPGVFGRVFEGWKRYNPEARPTILFGPDVKGSLFFAEEFHKAGVRAAHIDGDNVWVDGEMHSSNEEIRSQVLDEVRKGYIAVVCNRFVLREGIDLPELYHAIFATVFGSLTSYIQSGGRVLRAHPSLDGVVIQDHGGNWHRHGSLNSDREWELGLTNHRVVSERAERFRDKEDKEPIVCPKCGRVRLSGPTCIACGYAHEAKSRMVVQISGELKEMRGDIFRPRRIRVEPDTERKWERYYHSMKRANRTFRQAYGWFHHKEHYEPPRTLPLMPVRTEDWYRKIGDVPYERLIPKGGQT
jgi:superfamily II DNA or RNA helicase